MTIVCFYFIFLTDSEIEDKTINEQTSLKGNHYSCLYLSFGAFGIVVCAGLITKFTISTSKWEAKHE